MALFNIKNKSVTKNSAKKKKEQKPLEPQYYRAATGDRTINYHVYYLSSIEKILYFIVGFVAGAAVGYLFYGGIAKDEYGDPTQLTYILNIVIVLLCGTVCGRLFLPIRQKQILRDRQKKLKIQFRDMLEALSTALGAGKNVPESFASIYVDMKNQYEEDAFILCELEIINNGMNNGINLEELINDFGKRSNCSDIEDFANVFEISYRKGGNVKETIRNTCSILTDKMSIVEEIETTVAGSKNEQYVMLVLPIILVGMIKLSSPDFAKNFTTLSGIVSTTIAIVLFAVSYFVGQKLLDIKV